MSEPPPGVENKPSILGRILPKNASNEFYGSKSLLSKICVVVLFAVAIVGIVRSCIHIFAPDGGAWSIAGIDVNVAGGDAIIFTFALWGSEQLLMGIVEIVVCIRYRNLVPLMFLIIAGEYLLRILVGHIKPIVFAWTPPGAWADYVVLPVAIVMFVLSMIRMPPRPTKVIETGDWN